MHLVSSKGHLPAMVKKVVDHKMDQEGKYLFLLQWEKKDEESWEPEMACEDIKDLINNYFSKKQQINQEVVDTSKPPNSNECWNQKKLINKAQQLDYLSRLGLELISKSQRKGMSKIKSEQIIKIKDYIVKLTDLIRETVQRRDYQIDYLEGVFRNKLNQISFVVKTFQHNRYYIITIDTMLKHYPRTLRHYFLELINLHLDQQLDFAAFFQEERKYNEALKNKLRQPQQPQGEKQEMYFGSEQGSFSDYKSQNENKQLMADDIQQKEDSNSIMDERQQKKGLIEQQQNQLYEQMGIFDEQSQMRDEQDEIIQQNDQQHQSFESIP